MGLNEIQLKAVNTIDKNVVLIAGAGTGKTGVLSKRFLNILREGNNIEQILAITFTKKAAAEMKSRISDLLIKSDEEILRENLKYFSMNNIFTIHGFCSEIIKRYGTEFGYAEDFTVCEEQEANELYKIALENVLIKKEDNDILFNLLTELEHRETSTIKDNLIELHNDLRSKGISLDELDRLNEEYNNSISEPDFTKLLELLAKYNSKKPGRKFPSFYNEDETKEFLEKPYLEFLPKIIENLGTSKNEAEDREEIKSEINLINKVFEKNNYEYYKLISEILRDAELEYNSIKKIKNTLDYEDLQLGAIKILNTGIDLGYKFIMVDEFQDTNRLQVEILKYLTEKLTKNNIFVVGDPKQSIYSFRGGDIEEFKSFTAEMTSKGAINLSMVENYRSSRSLIETFNQIFEKILLNEYDSLNHHVDGDEKLKVLNIVEDEILEVSSYAKSLSENNPKEEVAILFRRKQDIDAYESTLKDLGVKVVNTSKSFSQIREIRDILSLLRYLDNKRDYLSLLEFLKTPFVGLKENSIFEIGIYLKENKNIKLELENRLEKSEALKFEEALLKINQIRNELHFMKISDILNQCYIKFRMFEISRLYAGKNAAENLEELLKLTIEYESAYDFNLGKFVNYIINLNTEDNFDKEGIKLITIHKSKGLEFDHVILADTRRNFINNGLYKQIVFGEVGLGIKLENRNSKFSEIVQRENQKTLDEERRIFYVALTRAKKTFSIINNEFSKSAKDSYWSLFVESEFQDYEQVTSEVSNTISAKNIYFNEEVLSLNKSEDISLIRDNYHKKRKLFKYYSASAYIQYKLSPENFYKKYFLGEEIESSDGEYLGDLDPIVRGNIVHKFAELEPKNRKEFLLEQLKYYNVESTEEILYLLNLLIDNLEITNSGKILEREFQFYYPLRNGIINGYIDQVKEVDGKIEIVDFKTGKMSLDKVKMYSPQLRIYAKAYESITGKKVSYAKLNFLADRKIVDISIEESDITDTINDFEKFIDFVEENFASYDY